MKIIWKSCVSVLLIVIYPSCFDSATLPPYRFQLPVKKPQETANREDRKPGSKTQFPYPFAATGNGTTDGLLEGGDLHQRFSFEMRLLNAARQNKVRKARHQQTDKTNENSLFVTVTPKRRNTRPGKLSVPEKGTGTNYTPPIFRDIPEMVFGESGRTDGPSNFHPVVLPSFPISDNPLSVKENSAPVARLENDVKVSQKSENLEKFMETNSTTFMSPVAESSGKKPGEKELVRPADQPLQADPRHLAAKEGTATLGHAEEPHQAAIRLRTENVKKILQIINTGLKDMPGPKPLTTISAGEFENKVLLSLIETLRDSKSLVDSSRKSKSFNSTARAIAEVNLERLAGNFSAALYSCLIDWAPGLDVFTCAQDEISNVIDVALAAEKIHLVPGFLLTRHDASVTDKSSEENEMKLKGVAPVGDWIGKVIDKIGTFFRTFSLDVSLGDLDLELEGRGHHHYRRVFPIVVTTYMIMSTFLIPMGFQFMAMLGGKALVLSKLAFLWSLFGVSRRIFPYSYPDAYGPPHHDFHHQPGLYHRAAQRKDQIS